jgi:hypothetical protein
MLLRYFACLRRPISAIIVVPNQSHTTKHTDTHTALARTGQKENQSDGERQEEYARITQLSDHDIYSSGLFQCTVTSL